MSEVSTSPAPAAAPAAESSAPAPSESVSVESSAPVAVDSGTVESPASTGELSASTGTLAESIPAEATEVQPSSIEGLSAPEFNPDSWDGNIESLPENLKGPIQFLHRQLEGGYTKKFQELSDHRKDFETGREQQERESALWKVERDEIVNERNLLKTLLDGEDDPRISDLSQKNSEYQEQLATLQGEYEHYKSLVEADVQEQAANYARRFREDNAEIFDSGEKRSQLSALMKKGWSPETGAKLVGQAEQVIALADELREKGTPENIAMEHAFLSLNQSRSPRPAAQLTAGAESRNNPESVSRNTINTNNPNEARFAAARAALEWKATNKLS